jgi:hypothetical protein
MMNIEYFLKNNSGGQKTREKWLGKNNLEYYTIIKKWSDKYGFNELPYKEQIYLCCNGLTKTPKCIECGKDLKFKKSLSEGYPQNYCSMKCMNSSDDHKNKSKKNRDYVDIIKKTKKTFLEKYGVDNIFKRSDLMKESYIKKFGVDHPLKYDKIKEKQKQTVFNKYSDWVITGKKSRKVLLDGYIKKTQEMYPDLNFIEFSPYSVKIKCGVCNEEYEITRALLRYRYNNNVNSCILCNPILEERSIKEKELYLWLSNYTNVIRCEKNILNGKEIDLYLPEYNIGIEFNGLYYHSNLFIGNNYHMNKTKLGDEKGVNIVHIYEDDWMYKQDIIKSIILNKIKKTPDRIYARKCVIKEIPINDCEKFLNKNHIQGHSFSKYNIGLFYNDELVSLMTFGKRKITGRNSLELIRFCNKLNTNVLGSASKLFKYFIEKYKPEELISYQDIGLFNSGNLYGNLGFKLKHISLPNYWYIINRKREYRYNWRKDVLIKKGFDPNKTEKEIMEELGYYRIYDCGTRVWEWNI